MATAINPEAIPGADLDPDTIEAQAGVVTSVASRVRENGSDVHLKWQGMAGVYSAPESGRLLGLMQPVSSQATAVGDNLDVVAGALKRFAADIRPIKAELDSLRAQAVAFNAEIAGGVSVREVNPAWITSQSSYGGAASYSYSSSSLGGGSTSTTDIPQYRTVSKEWHEVQSYVDRNNDLIGQVNAQQTALWEAERACANTIRALYGAARLRAYQSEDDALGYGLSEIPEGTEMPWGAEVERTEGCGEATAKFVFKDFLWEGIAVGGVWGTIEGLGTLVLGYNPETGDWFSGDAYGAAWGNLGMLGAAGLMNSGLLAPIFQADSLAQSMGGDGFLPQEVRDFKADADEVAVNTGKALIAWDKWADDPGTALGESVFNVGTILIPGGAAVAGVKTAGTAASVLSKMSRAVDVIDPGAWAVNGATRLGSLGLGSLDNLIGKVDGFESPNIEVYTATDAASGMRLLDDFGVDPNTVTARVDGAGNNVLDFPGGKIEMPAGTFDNAAGGGVRAGDGGAETSVAAPVREPELVTSGGVRGETTPGAVNSIVDDAPVRTETGGTDGSGGESTVVREPDTATGGDTGGNGATRGDDAATTGGQGTDGAAPGGSDAITPERGSSADGGAPPAAPARVYSLMDGSEHRTSFAPEALGDSRVTTPLLDSYGVTRKQFEDLINRPIDSLTGSEKSVINGVRNDLTAQVGPDTVFQKVLDQPHFDETGRLVFGQGENLVLTDEASITGSVSVADDTAHLSTPADFYNHLRLDYPGTKFLPDDGTAYVLRFQEQVDTAGAVDPQLHSSMGGDGRVDNYSPPFTGNGFLKTGDDIIPEYRADKAQMRDGAEMWEVLDDGTQRLFAVLRAGEWIPVG